MNDLLSCRHLTRRPFFVGWSLDLARGERVVLRGPSGSGKTLLLRGIADLDPFDEESLPAADLETPLLLLEGEDRRSMAPHEWRRRVLYLHPTAPRFPGTVASNLERTPRIEPVPASLPGLDPDLDAERLSSGESQLLALHRGLARGPRVLLLDEPTSALDPERARAVETTLVSWCGTERGLLWISHDPDLAARLGAREVSLA